MISVVTAAGGAEWEARLLAELESAGSAEFEVVRRCVDIVELLAVAGSGLARVALVDAQLRHLDADATSRLALAAVAVVGVVRADADEQLLYSAGVEFSVPADAPAAMIASVLALALAELGTDDRALSQGFADSGTAARVTEHPDADVAIPFAAGSVQRTGGGVSPDEAGQSDRRGSVVAVWGPTGAPGRTVVATSLADEIARLGPAALLIDADVYGGVAASTFGLLDESPGLVAACRQAQSRRLDTAGLAALCWQLAPSLRVLTGIARADRWPEIRPTAMTSVLSVARTLADFTVLDLGFGLETDEELSFDTVAPRRNGATLAALDEADLVLVVGSADPVGLQRLVRGLEEFRAAEIDTPTWVVLNRVRPSAVPGDPATELGAALLRFTGRKPAALLPYDLPALDRAALSGRTLAEATPGGVLRRAMTELAAAVTGVAQPHRGRRRK